MKKIVVLILSVCLVFVSAFALVACGGEEENPPAPTPSEPTPSEPTPSETTPSDTKLDFNVTFAPVSVVYDGTAKSVAVTGAPEGTSIVYAYTKGGVTVAASDVKDAGEYSVTAVLTKDGYNEKTVTTTLTITKATITGVTFAAPAAKTYDGTAVSVAASGIPTDAAVTYACSDNNVTCTADGASATNAGTYDVTVTVTKANYNDLVLHATLTINKATITGVTFPNVTESYDGLPHTITVVGQLPAGSSVTYSCDNLNVTCGASGASATAAGTYAVTATVTNANYNDLVLEGTLTIKGSEKERHIGSLGNTLYFANALDHDRLYKWDGSKVTSVNTDTPFYFVTVSNTLYYKSSALFGTSIRKVSATEAPSTVATAKADYLCSDGTNFYYVKNALVSQEKSGIYRLPVNADENSEPVLVSEGKAKYLQIVGNTLYFADGANDDKLSSVPASGNGATRTLVRDVEIKTLTASGNALFYTVNGSNLNDYIERYDIASQKATKLTDDAGGNLTVIGNTLYYLNMDWLTSTLYGDGIYSVPANAASDSTAKGTQVLAGDTQYTSLTSFGSKLAFYRVNDQMLCVYDPTTQATTEVLADFEVVEQTPASLGSKMVVYRNSAGHDVIYYLDIYNNKSIYAYDTVDKTFSKITSEKATDLAIIGDTLYYNAVTLVTNNDLYKIDLKEGGSPEKISKSDCVDIVSDGTRLFYVKRNEGGVRTAIGMIDAEGAEKDIYNKGVNNLVYHGGMLYFEDGGKLYKLDVSQDTIGSPVQIADHNFDVFVIDGDMVYFREKGTINKYLSCMKLDGTEYSQMVTKIDPVGIWVKDGTVYYYSDTVSKDNAGIFSVSTTCRADSETPTKILARDGAIVGGKEATYCAEEFVIAGDVMYFVNYCNTGGVGVVTNAGDSHFYSLPLGGGTPERLDV